MLAILAFGVLLFQWPSRGGESAATIRSLRFPGCQAVSVHELSGVMASREGAPWSGDRLAKDLGSLLRLYHERGFYEADVRLDSTAFTPDSSAVDITIAIHEGNPARIAHVRCRGNAALTDDRILKGFETRAGAVLDARVLEHDINELLSAYERIGLPFAKVEVEDVSLLRGSAQDGLDVSLFIEEGPCVTVEEITVAGNRETKDRVILRETRVRLHEPYDEDKVRRIQQRLSRLGIFSSVSDPELYLIPGVIPGPNPGAGGLLIKVEEGNTNTFDGVVGYAPGGRPGEGGSFSGIANVSMRNLFGTARRLDVHWQRDDSQTQEMALQYVEPWVLDEPVNLGAAFRQRQQDSSYISRGVEARADLLFTESLTVGGVFSHSVVIPSSTAAGQNVSNSRTITAGLDVSLDTRDDLLSPTSGALYRSGYRIGTKKVFGLQAQPAGAAQGGSVQRISVDAEMFLETFKRQVLATGVHGRQITTDRIETTDLYRFGGTNTLRGYRENEFLGSRIAWTNTEYRFLLARRSYFCGFFDAGYYYLPADAVTATSSSQELKTGYGIGIRLATGLGNIGVSIAFGEGDSFGQGKLHIGLANEF